MKNLDKIFIMNPTSNYDIKLKNARVKYISRKGIIDGAEINNIINFVNSFYKQYKKTRIPIVFDFGSIQFKDKLTYIILECICYYMMVNKKHQVRVDFLIDVKHLNIITSGILSSPLMLIVGNRSKQSTVKFPDKFNYDSFNKHHRSIIKGDIDTKKDGISKIMDSVKTFLKIYSVEPACCDEIAEVITELAGNAIEHTKSDCLIDIDIADNYKKEGNDIDEFYGINIVVLNFSENLLGDSLKNKMNYLNNMDVEKNKRYDDINKAYNKHSEYFENFYTEQDFYNVASFQDQISGDQDKTISGGKGLTCLIRSLANRSDFHSCYVLTGHRILQFEKDFIELNKDKWVGFNKERNFLGNIPANESINCSKVYFPGTAYNLNFVIKKEVYHE